MRYLSLALAVMTMVILMAYNAWSQGIAELKGSVSTDSRRGIMSEDTDR